MSANIDQYISQFSEEIQVRLQHIRTTIRQAAPEATECISYGIPTFKLQGNLVHYGGFKNHIGFFPTAKGIADFAEDLKKFPTSKGTVQFLHSQPLPLALIKKMVKYRIKEQQVKKINKKKTTK